MKKTKKKKKSMVVRVAQFAALAYLRNRIAEKDVRRAEELASQGRRGRAKAKIGARVPNPEKMLFQAMGGRDAAVTVAEKKITARNEKMRREAAKMDGLSGQAELAAVQAPSGKKKHKSLLAGLVKVLIIRELTKKPSGKKRWS